jgi:hypothetical protein
MTSSRLVRLTLRRPFIFASSPRDRLQIGLAFYRTQLLNGIPTGRRLGGTKPRHSLGYPVPAQRFVGSPGVIVPKLCAATLAYVEGCVAETVVCGLFKSGIAANRAFIHRGNSDEGQSGNGEGVRAPSVGPFRRRLARPDKTEGDGGGNKQLYLNRWQE